MHDVTEKNESDVTLVHPTRFIVPADIADWLSLFLQVPICLDAGIEPTRVDAQAFADWCLAGVGVCQVSDDAENPWTPQRGEAKDAAEAFVLRVLVRRHNGNITHAAASGKTSRRALREALKRHGMYIEPGEKMVREADYPLLTWEMVSLLKQLAATAPDPESTMWEQAANVGIQRIRQAGKQASRIQAERVIEKLREGMTDLAVATVIPGPVTVSLVDGHVLISDGEDREVTDAGRLGKWRALDTLTKALIRLGGPVEPMVEPVVDLVRSSR